MHPVIAQRFSVWEYRESEFTLEQISSPMIDKSTRANILAMYFALLCCAPLCCAVLRCVVLCSAVLRCAVLRCCAVSVVVLCYAVVLCPLLCCALLCCVVLHCVVFRCVVLHCVITKKVHFWFTYEYRGTLLGSSCGVTDDVNTMKIFFSCIIWDDLSISGDKLKLHWVV